MKRGKKEDVMLRHLFIAVVCATLLLPLFVPQARASTGSEIVDTPYVAAALERGTLLWDVRDEREYLRGHIRGAVNIGAATGVLRDDNREDYLPTPQIARILGEAGIDLGKEIIVYGTKGDAGAYFALLTIRHFGGHQGRVYHGGIDDWVAARMPLSAEPTRRAPVALQLRETAGVSVSTDDVLARLERRNVQILDVRTADEYRGLDIRAIRGGRIKGAINIPYEENWLDPDTPLKLAMRRADSRDGMALKPHAELQALYAKLDPRKETIVYCQSGVRAAQTATVLRELGFQDVKVYDSSWLGYAGRLEAPAEDVTFVNVGLLNARIRALQYRVDQLERQLAATRGR